MLTWTVIHFICGVVWTLVALPDLLASRHCRSASLAKGVVASLLGSGYLLLAIHPETGEVLTPLLVAGGFWHILKDSSR